MKTKEQTERYEEASRLHLEKMQRKARGEDERKPAKAKGKRFEFQNALVRSGWLFKLSIRELKVLFVLNTHANNELKVRIGHTAISIATGIRREHVARTTKALERKGFIRCTSRGRTMGKKGKRESNEYQLPSELPQLNSAASSTIEPLE